MSGPQKIDVRQIKVPTATAMIGSSANATLDTLLPIIDAELGKLFEDRNVMLSDGGTITFTGTQVQFTENLKLRVNQNIAGANPYVISLGSSSQNFVNSGDMMVAVINRTAQTATVSIVTSGSALPAAAAANEEVFLIAIRLDAGDGTQRLYFRNGSAFNAGQTARLGSAGSGGSGSGIGDDLDSLQFRASFSDLFTESYTNANSSINSSGTNATFNAAKSMYTASYDASKTVSTSGVTATMSGAPAFTVAIGDILVSGGVARKITAVASQTSYTLEAAFSSNLSAAACCVSQAVYTKDIYNAAIDGVALSSSFGGSTFSEIMVDYKDNATSGSNLWTPNTTPFIGFVASPDNSTFTTVQTRATNETDTAQSTLLSSAGTSLYLRFFANQSSGSGTVNLIAYKAFMQKSVTAAGTNNVLWSTFGMTNNSTTPLNCTISVVGGKTTIQVTNNTYPVGANPGTTVGALEVLLNGLSVDRFVSGSTPSGDAYFTEVDQRTIQLDRDYSSQALSISLIYSLQVIDSSSTNTTAISQQQEIMGNSFQGFVNQPTLTATTATGSPASGLFYSSIPLRGAMADFTQDLKPRLGLERIITQELSLLLNEFGPNGEPVFSVSNDLFNQIRLIGQWSQSSSTNGVRVEGSNNTTDYCEITFYGTGLNMLTTFDNNSTPYSLNYAVDGGSEVSFYNATPSAVLQTRSYGPNIVLPVVSGLSLGIHTVKIRNLISTNAVPLLGFEILNQVSTGSNLVNVNPGIGYISGKKLVTSAQSQVAYNALSVGTKGGRVLTYQKSDGTIGQSYTQVNSSILTLSSADHTNEEVVRVYNWREFGTVRSDDYATLGGSARPATFTLDDGTTTLSGNTQIVDPNVGSNSLSVTTQNNFAALTFVGTGLDVVLQVAVATNARSIAYQIDGGSIVTITTTTSGQTLLPYTQKIVSGLPYGTHTIKFINNVSTGNMIGINSFIVYQPKKPTLPSGAIELADFNIMANFSASTTDATVPSSVGTLLKAPTREFTYSGSWTLSQNTSNTQGMQAVGGGSGAYAEYTFFGAGFELVATWNGSTATTATITIDGTLYTGSATVSNGNLTWTAGTSTVTVNASTGGCLAISGLTLGLHKVRITQTSSASFYINALSVITPIHSAKSSSLFGQQGVGPVGSNAISDNRKITILKDAAGQRKNISTAIATAPGGTTTSTVDVPMPDMTVIHTNTSGRVLIAYSVGLYQSSGASSCNVIVYVDGVPLPGGYRSISQTTTTTAADIIPLNLSPGTHIIQLFWNVGGNTGNLNGTERRLIVTEL